MPAEYAIQLTEGSDKSILVPDHLTIISAGRITLSNSLNGDNTYGTDIALPVANVLLANLVVIAVPITVHEQTVFQRWVSGGALVYNSHYADSSKNYYTRNESNGVMSAWTAGNRTASSKATWDPVLSTYPVAFWDKMGAATFSNIRLFAATAHLVRDGIADTNFCLAGTASNSGGQAYQYGGEGDGTANNVKDGIGHTYNPGSPTGTGWGTGHNNSPYMPGTEDSSSCTVEVDLGGAKTIDAISVNYMWDCYPGDNPGSANAGATIEIYVGGSWYTVLTISISGDTWDAQDSYVYGFWKNVTKIRASLTTHTQCGSTVDSLWSVISIGELRAWGPNAADDNKIVYTIGNAGVEEIDYLVAMKEYT